MASEFPGSPKLLKGALVVFETKLPVPTNLIVFQYNPDTMTRRVEPVSLPQGRGGGTADTQHVQIPPLQTFQLSIELDATDGLEEGNALASAVGVHPALAALELLLYPPSTALILNKVLSLAGSSMISPAATPLVLFVWGPARVVPVRVTSVSIVEQAFDQLLNPIRAKVDLGLRGLTIKELQEAGTPFDALALVGHVSKEVLARMAGVAAVADIGGSISL